MGWLEIIGLVFEVIKLFLTWLANKKAGGVVNTAAFEQDFWTRLREARKKARAGDPSELLAMKEQYKIPDDVD